MELSYDEIADAMYIYITRSKIAESDQINENIIVDYDENHNIRGIELIQYSQLKFDLNALIKLSSNELITKVTAS